MVRVGQVNPNPNIMRDTIGMAHNVTALYRTNRTGKNRDWNTILLVRVTFRVRLMVRANPTVTPGKGYAMGLGTEWD